MLRFDKTRIYGLSESSEMSRDCDVTYKLLSVMATRSDNETSLERVDEESVYANTAPVMVYTSVSLLVTCIQWCEQGHWLQDQTVQGQGLGLKAKTTTFKGYFNPEKYTT